MNKREKVLVSATGAVALVFVLGLGVKEYVFGNLGRLEAKIQERQSTLSSLNKLALDRQTAEQSLADHAKTTFGAQTNEAAARAGEHITALLSAAGLDGTLFTRTYAGRRPIRGRFADEISWNVNGKGAMKRVVDLLYLLEADPHLHRVESLSVRPQDDGVVRVQFRYLTLVITRPSIAVNGSATEPAALDSEERVVHDAITLRNIFRPYVKRDASPLPPPKAIAKPTGPGPESFRIVSLTQWLGEPEILILNVTSNETKKYRVGDTLAGGVLMQVDYRALPAPRKPGLQSLSRVIIGSDGKFWAVENGDSLADKYLLSSEHLPPGLEDES